MAPSMIAACVRPLRGQQVRPGGGRNVRPREIAVAGEPSHAIARDDSGTSRTCATKRSERWNEGQDREVHEDVVPPDRRPREREEHTARKIADRRAPDDQGDVRRQRGCRRAAAGITESTRSRTGCVGPPPAPRCGAGLRVQRRQRGQGAEAGQPTRPATSCTASVFHRAFSDATGIANRTDAEPAMYTIVGAMPAMNTPRGIVRSGSSIS